MLIITTNVNTWGDLYNNNKYVHNIIATGPPQPTNRTTHEYNQTTN